MDIAEILDSWEDGKSAHKAAVVRYVRLLENKLEAEEDVLAALRAEAEAEPEEDGGDTDEPR